MAIRMMLAAAALAGATIAGPAMAQESTYKTNSIWYFSQIKVLPGQFENYMDYLSGNWRKQNELAKKMANLVSYHIFAVSNARAGEPDLILATEYKDFVPVAEREKMSQKIMATMAMDPHKAETASAGREPMRTQLGSMELEELTFK